MLVDYLVRFSGRFVQVKVEMVLRFPEGPLRRVMVMGYAID